MVALLLLIGTTGCGTVDRHAPGRCAGACACAPDEGDLLGATTCRVLKTLGIPAGCCGGSGHSFWAYADRDGKMHEKAVAFCGGRVIRIDPTIEKFADPVPPPEGKPYPGQPVEQLVRLLGQPDRISVGSAAVELYFGERTVTIQHGRVAGMSD